jgi:hypothetical protein
LLAIDEVYSVSVDDAVTVTLNFKVVGNQVNRAARDERVLGLGWRIAETTGIASRRIAASSVDSSRSLWLTEALSLATHVGLLATILTPLAMVWGLLHVVTGVLEVVGALALHGVHLLLGSHELVLLLGVIGLLLWWPSPKWLLV